MADTTPIPPLKIGSPVWFFDPEVADDRGRHRTLHRRFGPAHTTVVIPTSPADAYRHAWRCTKIIKQTRTSWILAQTFGSERPVVRLPKRDPRAAGLLDGNPLQVAFSAYEVDLDCWMHSYGHQAVNQVRSATPETLADIALHLGFYPGPPARAADRK